MNSSASRHPLLHPRALLRGKQLLDDGDYAGASTQLNLAATLLRNFVALL